MTICVLPMFHIFSLNGTVTNTIYCGGKLVSIPRWDPLMFLKAMTGYRPTFLHLAPPLLSFLANHPSVKTHHLESLR